MILNASRLLARPSSSGVTRVAGLLSRRPVNPSTRAAQCCFSSSQPTDEPAKSDSHLSATTFASVQGLCSNSKSALKDVLKFDRMTTVQAATLPVILSGKDVFAKAKTGTGKTTAFLLPAIEHASKPSSVSMRNKVHVLIISPTRELALQIVAEANQLTTHNLNCKIGCMVGGTSVAKDLRMLARAPAILVATPGRICAHLRDTPDMRNVLNQTGMLILDEADRLLDMGFTKDIDTIRNTLPSQRQTTLFSATMPDSVLQVAKRTLRPGFEVINTVSDDDDQTHSHVKQDAIIAHPSTHLSLLYQVIEQHRRTTSSFKIIVFFPTARAVIMATELFNDAREKVMPMHARLSQSKRTNSADKFRQKENLIMFTSDVTARGMQYDGVTLVVQVGMASNAEQYIHRLGRTGRAGNKGQGIAILQPIEENFYNAIKAHAGVGRVPQAEVDAMVNQPLYPRLAAVVAGVGNEDSKLNGLVKGHYSAWLGFYLGQTKSLGVSKQELVRLANDMALDLGLDEVPEIPKNIIGKMGLKGVEGVRIGPGTQPQQRSSPSQNNSPKNKSNQQRHTDNNNNNKRRDTSKW